MWVVKEKNLQLLRTSFRMADRAGNCSANLRLLDPGRQRDSEGAAVPVTQIDAFDRGALLDIEYDGAVILAVCAQTAGDCPGVQTAAEKSGSQAVAW